MKDRLALNLGFKKKRVPPPEGRGRGLSPPATRKGPGGLRDTAQLSISANENPRADETTRGSLLPPLLARSSISANEKVKLGQVATPSYVSFQ